MSKFIINGGRSLEGEIVINGSKNASLPIIAASLLLPEVYLQNVPRIRDVEVMLEIVKDLGGSYEWLGQHELRINTENLTTRPVSERARKLRASIALAGPLLARFKEAHLSYPGGDIIGARPLDTHLNAFRDLGVEVKEAENLSFKIGEHRGGTLVLEESSVLATENIIIYAAGISEPVVIKLAATEPHVQDLCRFLMKAGVKIEGVGTSFLKIKGPAKRQAVKHKVISDDIEASGFAALAATTHSNLLIKSINFDFFDSVLLQLRKMNVNFQIEKGNLHILPPNSPYKAFRLQSAFYPKLLSDHLPPLAVLATQAEGATLVHDWLYEGRQSYIRELIKMGANATIMDPHRALIIGPTPLYGKEVVSFDIRSGMAMIVAALAAEGRTIINDVQHVDRGYENLYGRLKELGADIVRED